jgi:hypothetical protein
MSLGRSLVRDSVGGHSKSCLYGPMTDECENRAREANFRRWNGSLRRQIGPIAQISTLLLDADWANSYLSKALPSAWCVR